MHHNTQNLADFGTCEREEAGLLLSTLGTTRDNTRFFGDRGVTVEFNPNSGYVFLVDEDYNVAMMDGENLEDFITCPNCGNEGLGCDFREDFGNDSCCMEYADDLEL